MLTKGFAKLRERAGVARPGLVFHSTLGGLRGPGGPTTFFLTGGAERMQRAATRVLDGEGDGQRTCSTEGRSGLLSQDGFPR